VTTARTSLVVLAGVLAAVSLAAQQPAPYRGGVELVSVTATVTDAQQRLVTTLTQDDFTVFDNGKPQPLAFFTNGVEPISIVVMLDRSGSMMEHFGLVRDATAEFVRRLLPSDRARIGDFGMQILINPKAFTSDHYELIDILHNRLQRGGVSPVWAAIDRGVSAVAKEDGKRVVLVFSDGYNSPLPFQDQVSLKDLMKFARRSGVMVYAVGVAIPEDLQFTMQPSGVAAVPMPPGAKMVKPDPGLKKLATESGGGYFELDWNADLTATFTRVAEELHHQYTLGFAPKTLDGKVHKLEVKVGHAGLTVRARTSYEAK